jgi:hypothetical protein
LLAADWYRTVFISKSVLGCLVLKFIGSSLVSLSHGKMPSWVDHPSYIISFLIAFCLVRSDSIEARELSGHMRYAAPATVALNLAAALYKMRSISHLAEQSDVLGPFATLAYGTLAFSACNALMVIEHLVLSRLSLPAALEARAKKASTPDLRVTLKRHFCYLALLLASHGLTSSRIVLSIAKVIVLGSIFANYNEGLLIAPPEADTNGAEGAEGAEGASSASSAARLIQNDSSTTDLLMATLHIPSPAKRPPPVKVPTSEQSLLGGPLIWLLGILSVGWLDVRGPAGKVARPAVSLLRREAGQQQASALGGLRTPTSVILGAAASIGGAASAASSATKATPSSAGLTFRGAPLSAK